jgi:hypothetical protein
MAGVSLAPSQREPDRSPMLPEHVQTLHESGGLGRLRRLARALLGPGPELVLIPGPRGPSPDECAPLQNALIQNPVAALACGGWDESTSVPQPPDRSLAALLMSPRSLGSLLLRRSVIGRLGLPDFGPSDAVLDAACSWAITVAIVARGGSIVFGSPAAVGQPVVNSCAPEALTAEGRAWLVREALGWLPEGSLTPALAAALWARCPKPDSRGLAPSGHWETGP